MAKLTAQHRGTRNVRAKFQNSAAENLPAEAGLGAYAIARAGLICSD